MPGIVKKINHDKRLVMLEDDFGEYAVFELQGKCHIEPGDEISGDFHSPGEKILRNESKEEMISVHVQEAHIPFQRAEQMLG
jgi:hypothetical protein